MTPIARSALCLVLLALPLTLSGAAFAKGRAGAKAKSAKTTKPSVPAPTTPPSTSQDPFASATTGSVKVRSFSGNLESPKVDIFPVKAGHCYLVVLRLGAGATLERKSLQMDWPNSAGEQQPVSFGAHTEAPSGAVFQPDCATAAASIGVWVGLQSFDGIKPLGKGAFTIDVFERKASKAQLAAEAAADKKFRDDSAKERHEARAKTCGECSSPSADRKVCLERRGVTMKDCGW